MEIVTDIEPGHVANRLNTLFDQLEKATPRGIDALSRSDLPYALHIDREGWVLPLNRRYQAIGTQERGYCDYWSPEFKHLRFPACLLGYPVELDEGDTLWLASSVEFANLHHKAARAAYLSNCRRMLGPLLGSREALAA